MRIRNFKLFENQSELKYKIKIDYKTGDSENTWSEIDYIPLEWDNLSVAKSNLQRIKKHKEMCNKLNERGWRSSNRLESLKKFFDGYLKDDWFVSKPKPFSVSKDGVVTDLYAKSHPDDCQEIPDPHYAEHTLYLHKDDGEKIQISAFWQGHFESLKSIEIEENRSKDDEDTMRIEF